METDPILIRIQAFDEATQVIDRVATSLKRLEIKIPEIDLGTGIEQYTKINTILPKTTQIFKSQIDSVESIGRAYTKWFDTMEVEPIENLNAYLMEAGITQKQFTNFLTKNNLEMIKGVGVYDRLSGSILTQGQAIKLATIQTRRFKFEWLSIMFAGMALNRTFGGLVKTQMELFGVTGLLSDAWTIVLLPIMEKIAPLLYTLLDAFMNLPEPVKLAIGAFVLFAAGLGQLLTIIGQIVLAVMGFKLLGITSFAALGKAVAPFLSALAPIAAVIAGIGLIILGIYDIAKGKFEGIGLIIMGVGLILALFIGWWALIPIAVGAAVWAIIKYWEPIKNFFIKLWEGIKSVFSKYWAEILLIVCPPVGIVAMFIKYWGPLTAFFGKLWEGIKKIFWTFIDWVESAFDKVWKLIIKGFEAVGKVFKTIWEGIKTAFKGAINFIISVMNFGIKGFESMINFAIKGINALIKLINKIPGVNIKTLGAISLPRIPYLQEGGLIKTEGLAYLHAGERVIPRKEVSGSIIFSPTINLNANVSSDYDVRKLATQLNRYWATDFERAIKGRGR